MPARPAFRVAILGLDGLSLDIAQAIASRGQTPHLAALCEDARLGTVPAELPELSPVNWTSFATGEGPEVHGVYGFTRMDPRQYTISIMDARRRRCPTVFERLGELGLTCRVLNLPGSWPANPRPTFQGTWLAGFVAPNLHQAAFPRELASELQQAAYQIEADTLRGASDPKYLLDQLHHTLRGRVYLMDRFLSPGGFDCFCLVLTETDRLFHFLLPAVLDAAHPWHASCLKFLSAWDAVIGEFFQRVATLSGETRVILLADHGFAPLRTEFDVNAWLRSQGYLVLGQEAAESELDARGIRPETTAFALDPARIYLHRKGLYARGGVQPQDEGALLERLRAGLMAVTWDGEPVMEAVHLGSELYGGGAVSNQSVPTSLDPVKIDSAIYTDRHDPDRPDLVCQSRPGVDLKAKFDRASLFGMYGRQGMHTARGAIFYDSHGDPAAPPRRMREVGQRVLAAFAGRGRMT